MQPSDFIQDFFLVYTIGAALILIILIGQILYMMRRVDRGILRAKIFLNEAVMQRTWMYISIAGAGFSLNTIFKFAIQLTVWGAVLNSYRLYEITQLVFVVAFILAVYNWYVFIASSRIKNVG